MSDAADLNPIINTVTMESVKAWQRAQCFIWLKLRQANLTFANSIIRGSVTA